MPILAQEPDIYPDTLLEDAPVATDRAEWYVIHTLSRREKELMRRLRLLGIAHYSPLTECRRRSPTGRIRTSYLPLFSGYVFVRGSDEDRHHVISTGCVSNCLEVSHPAELVTDLRRIQVLNGAGDDIRAEPEPLVGHRAIVTSGPMTGIEGTISQQHSQHRLTVIVTFMHQGVSVTIDEADVKLLD